MSKIKVVAGKLQDIISKYNQSGTTAIEDSGKIPYENQRALFLQEKISSIKSTSLSNVQELAKNLIVSIEEARSNYDKQHYPDMGTQVFESQIAEAKKIIEGNDDELVLSGIEEALRLKRINYLTYIFENYKCNQTFNQAVFEKLQEQFYKDPSRMSAMEDLKIAEDTAIIAKAFALHLSGSQFSAFQSGENSNDMNQRPIFERHYRDVNQLELDDILNLQYESSDDYISRREKEFELEQ